MGHANHRHILLGKESNFVDTLGYFYNHGLGELFVFAHEGFRHVFGGTKNEIQTRRFLDDSLKKS